VVLLAMAGCHRGPSDEKAKPVFEIDKVYERGPLTAHVRVDKGKISIAQTVLLQLEATASSKYEVKMPKVDETLLANFGLVSWDNLGRKLDPNNNVATTYQYRLEPFQSGTFDIPALTFVFQDVNDPNATHEVVSEPVSVEVTSLLGEDRAKLTIEDIEGVVEMPTQALWRWLWIAGGTLVVAAAVAWPFLKSRRVQASSTMYVPAHEIAYGNLQALVERKLIEQGQIKEFYERISGILRQYIEHRFRLHAPDRTTEEFLAELRTAETLSASDKDSLQEFLTHCDLVKFAKHAPTSEQIQRTFDLVKAFIEKTKSDECKVSVATPLAGPEVA
jgi:hypothetical protein